MLQIGVISSQTLKVVHILLIFPHISTITRVIVLEVLADLRQDKVLVLRLLRAGIIISEINQPVLEQILGACIGSQLIESTTLR